MCIMGNIYGILSMSWESSQVKSKFISIARLKTTELHQSAVQQIQYHKNSL